jgi:hypothetical protein
VLPLIETFSPNARKLGGYESCPAGLVFGVVAAYTGAVAIEFDGTTTTPSCPPAPATAATYGNQNVALAEPLEEPLPLEELELLEDELLLLLEEELLDEELLPDTPEEELLELLELELLELELLELELLELELLELELLELELLELSFELCP